eukprot:CCRYP_008997-RA/>CCRYP_008997-RA protein AED:0.07 eAED:-0.02 QI:0/0.66/0.25/1/1/1/4/0/1354
MHRPSSAISKRPASARPTSARTTQTKTFFDLREGTTNEEPPSPFIVNSERSYAVNSEANEALLSLLRDHDWNDEFLRRWDILKTEKPRVHIVEPVCLVGIESIDRFLRSYFGRYSTDDESENKVLVSTETDSQGFITYFLNLFLDSIAGGINAMRRMMAEGRFKRSEAASNETCDDAIGNSEGGLFVSETADDQHCTQRTVSIIEDRIRREISAYQTAEETTGQSDATEEETPAKKSELEATDHADESFWVSPRKNEVSHTHGHCHEPVVELAISVEEVKFRQHPNFIDEELIAGQIIGIYDCYRRHVESPSLHLLVKKLLELDQYIEPETEDIRLFQVTIHDLKFKAEKLLEELNCMKDLYFRLKNLWGALVKARETSGFVCTDIELKAESASNTEFDDDIQRLNDVIPSLRQTICSNKSYCQENDHTVNEALEALETMLHDNLEQCRCPLNLTTGKNVAGVGWIPKDEKARRRKITCERYFARLLIDDHPVGDTKKIKMEFPFVSVHLSHLFHCKLSRPPDKACIQLFMSPSGFLPARQFCSIFVSIPPKHITASGKQVNIMDWFEFATEYGLKGAVYISAGLRRTTTKSSLMVMTPHEVISTVASSKKTMIRQLQKAANQKHVDVDGYNPNSQLRMAFKLGSSTLLSSLFEEPPRHILIRKRQTNPNIVSPVPNMTSQNANEFNLLVKSDNEHNHEDIVENAMRERSVVSRQNLSTFVKALTENSLLQESKRIRTKKQYTEIIQDVGFFRFLDQNELRIPSIIPRKRSLYPASLRRLPTKNLPNRYSLFLTIVTGKNLPTRSNDSSAATTTDDSEEVHLGLVVKIQLRGKSYFTRAVTGSTTPFWNETVSVPLDFIKEFDKAPYSLLQDELVDVSVFDCIDTDMRNKGGFYDDEETKIVDYLYMGSVRVPFLTLLKHEQLDGFVRCSCPERIVGYSRQSITSPIGNGDDEDPRDLSSNLMLRIHATTDPAVAFPTESYADYPSVECQNLLSRINRWSELSLRCHFMSSDINCRILWPDTNGVSYIVSRFLTEQPPPHRFKTSESCAHYVSLIPTLAGWRSIEKLNVDRNFVFSSQQTINILAGNTKEHAVLLANFFLHLNRRDVDKSAQVYLVIGFAVPEGNTVWVMRKCMRSNEIVFWEATSGCAYACKDDSSPLQRIYCLVSKEVSTFAIRLFLFCDYIGTPTTVIFYKNVYANLEREKKPNALDFNLSISRKWAPLHLVDTNGEQPLPLSPMQGEVLHYSQPNHGYAKELQDDLKESIKTAIRRWRRSTTSFRTDIVAKLSSILDKLEDSKMSGKQQDTSGLDDLSKTRNVFGFPLHFAFTNIQDVLNQIKTTEIHRNRNPNVEFSVA